MDTLPSLPIIISALLAVLFELFPPLRKKWDEALNAKQKQIIMLLLIGLVSVAIPFYSAWRSGGVIADPVAVVEEVIAGFLLGIIAAQGTHSGIKYVYSPAEAG